MDQFTIVANTVAENNPAAIASTAMSIVAILINVAGALVQPLFGWLMKKGATGMGTEVYSATSYQSALIIMPIAFALSFLVALILKDTRCRKTYNDVL